MTSHWSETSTPGTIKVLNLTVQTISSHERRIPMLTAITLAAVLGAAPAQAGSSEPHQRAADHRRTRPDARQHQATSRRHACSSPTRSTGSTVDEQGRRELHDGDGSDRRGRQTDFQARPARSGRLRRTSRNKLPAGVHHRRARPAAGNYNCKISVTDPKTKATGGLNVKFEVLKKEFAVVAVFTSHDEDGNISAPTTGQVGQTSFRSIQRRRL